MFFNHSRDIRRQDNDVTQFGMSIVRIERCRKERLSKEYFMQRCHIIHITEIFNLLFLRIMMIPN